MVASVSDKLRAPTIPKLAVLENRRTCAAVSTQNSKRERQREERVAIDTHGRGTNYTSHRVDGAVLVIKSPSSHDDTRPSLREIICRMNPWRGRLIPLNRSLQVHFVKRFKNDQFDMITRFSKSLIGCRKYNFHPLFFFFFLFSFVTRGIYRIGIRETLSLRNLSSMSKYCILNLALSSVIKIPKRKTYCCKSFQKYIHIPSCSFFHFPSFSWKLIRFVSMKYEFLLKLEFDGLTLGD